MIGVDVMVRENIVMTGPISIEIVPECTSLPYLAIFLAGIMAFPTDIRQKLWGVLLGVIGLSLLNIIRMLCILLVGMFIPSIFDTAHVLVGQSLMIVATVVMWLFWWKRTLNDEGIQS
jgi:exosortase/archaeosortase family protein